MERNEEKRTDAEIDLSQNRLLSRLSNFWYHYKWILLIVAVFLLLGLVGLAQCSRQESGDVSVVFAGGYSMNAAQKTQFETALSLLVPKQDKPGETVTVSVTDYPVFSDEEIRAMFTDENGNVALGASESLRQQCVQNVNTFGDYILTGECGLYFVRESVYNAQNMTKLAAPLSEYFETIPAGAHDAYAVRIGDTAFYQYYEALHFLPEDTLIVLTKPYIYGATSQKAYYAYCESLFLAILNFEAPITDATTASQTQIPTIATTDGTEFVASAPKEEE